MATKLFCALDFDNEDAARSFYKQILPHHNGFKIGLELFCTAGPDFVRELAREGAEVFLDLKFHDIPNTVAGAVRQTANLGAKYINVHASGGEAMLRAARESLDDSFKGKGAKPLLLAVTVLTSMDESDLVANGITRGPVEQVVSLAENARNWGADGVVCGTSEIERIKRELGPEFFTMVPGIRPDGSKAGDQSRVATPAIAAAAGADAIVVGRPIREAKDPIAAIRAIMDQL